MNTMNSLRDNMKDAIAAALTGKQTVPGNTEYELAAEIADEVFEVLNIPPMLQDMALVGHEISTFKGETTLIFHEIPTE